MARCGCENTCNCSVVAGSGVVVTGTGGVADPYIVSSSASEAAWNYRTTDTVALTRTGQGTPELPYELKGDARLKSAGGLTSDSDGISVKVDPIAGNNLVVTASGLRVDAAAGVGVDPDGGIILGPDGLAVEIDPAAGNALTITAAGVYVPAADTTAIVTRMNQLLQQQRQQTMMSGGGLKRASPTRIQWAESFFLHAPRLTAVQAAQFYQITMPANGTVITGVGGAANTTIASTGNYAGQIALGDWQSLWYLIPTGSSTASVPANFRVAAYTTSYQMPDNAVLIAWRYGGDDKTVYWGDGTMTVPWRLGPNPIREGAGSVTGLGTGGVQALFYRNNPNGQTEVNFWARWGADASSPGGDLYWDLPFNTPAYDVARGNWTAVGVGKFFTSAAGSKAAMDWPMTPWIGNGSPRIYFLVPTAGNDIRLSRMRVHDGSFSAATSRPVVTEGYISTSGSELQGQLLIPAAGVIT